MNSQSVLEFHWPGAVESDLSPPPTTKQRRKDRVSGTGPGQGALEHSGHPRHFGSVIRHPPELACLSWADPPSVPHQHRAAFSQQVFGLGTTKGALAGGVGGRIYSLLPHLPGSLRVTEFTPEINTGTFTPWRDFSWRPSRRVTPATELGDREKLGLKATCSDVVSRLPRCPHLCLF